MQPRWHPTLKTKQTQRKWKPLSYSKKLLDIHIKWFSSLLKYLFLVSGQRNTFLIQYGNRYGQRIAAFLLQVWMESARVCSLCEAFILNGELGRLVHPHPHPTPALGKADVGTEEDSQAISCSEISLAEHMGSYPLLPHNQLLPQFLSSFLKGNKCFGSHNSLLAATINPKGKIMCNGFMGGFKVARSYARN